MSVRRPAVAVALLALLAAAAAAFLLLRDDDGASGPFTASGCQKGYVRLSDEYVRELREGAHGAAAESRREREEAAESEVGEARERGGKGYCLRKGVKRPEPFKDLMRASSVPLQRLGFDSPRQYARAARQKERLRDTRIPGTAGSWTPVGDGPVIFDDPDYRNTDSLANGLSRATGRITDFAYDGAGGHLFAAVSNGGVWMSDDRGKSWTSIGDNLPTQITGAVAWTPAGGGTLIVLTGDNAFGGNTYAGMGAYYTTDLGRTWTKARGLPDGSQGFRLAVRPDQPDTVYAATGFGLFRSTDAGRSWDDVMLPTGPCAGKSTSKQGCFLANVVTDVQVMGPDKFGHDGGAVVAAVGWRAGARKNPDGSVQAPANGIYTSPDGTIGSFRRTMSGFAAQSRVGRVALGAADGPGQDHRVVYALVQDAQLFDSGHIFGLDVPDIPDPILGGNLTATPTYLNGVYVSRDFGRTWTRMADGNQFLLPTNGSTLAALVALGFGPGIQAWYDEWIAPDPYTQTASGIPTRLVLGLEELYESRTVGQAQDGPTDFQSIAPYSTTGAGCILTLTNELCSEAAKFLGTTTHPDQHGALFLPPAADGKRTLVVGNDGGTYDQVVPGPRTHLTPRGFGPGNVKGLNTLLPYSIAVAKDGTAYSGLQDNGTIKVDPRTGRQVEVYGGDGTYVLVDPDDSNQALYAPAGGSLTVTHDGGRTNASVVPDTVRDPQFLTPFAFDDATASRIIYAARNVFVANKPIKDIDDSSPFEEVYDLGTAKHPGDKDADSGDDDPSNVATAVAMRDNTAYVGYCGSCDPVKENLRFKSGIATNAGGTWHIAAAKGLAQRLISALAVDPSDPKTVYAALGESTVRQFAPPHALGDDGVDPTGGHVYKSTDGGETFTDISGDLPDIGATSLLVRGQQLVVGTTVGAFASTSRDGGSWGLLGSDLPAAPVYAMQLSPTDPNTLYVASYGRGLYRYGFRDPSGVAAACVDRARPVSQLTVRRARAHRKLLLRGTSRDQTCKRSKRAKVRHVSVSVARRVAHGCRYLRTNGRFTRRATSCTKSRYIRAKGTSRWSFTSKRPIPAGHYRIWVRAIDRAGNVERKKLGRNGKRVTVRSRR